MYILDSFEQLEQYRVYFVLILTKGFGWSDDEAHDWSSQKTLRNFVTLTESPGFWLASVLIHCLNEKYACELLWELHPQIADILDLGLNSGESEWKPTDAAIGAKMTAIDTLVAEFLSKKK